MNLTSLLDDAIGSYGVFAVNLRTQKTVTYHEKDIFPSASTIKIPIMIELYRRVEEENLSLDAMVTMRDEDKVDGSGVLFDLTPGQAYSLRDLNTLMITVSDNTATNLLIDFLGVEAINNTMRRLGVHDTELVRRLQRVPTERSSVNRATAYDLAQLVTRMAHGEVISLAVSHRMIEVMKRCQGAVSITTLVPQQSFTGQPPTVTVAHKTGSLSDACHDVGLVYMSDGLSYAAALMSQGAPYAKLAPTLRRIGRALPGLLR